MNPWLAFTVGLFVGAFLGLLVAGLMAAAGGGAHRAGTIVTDEEAEPMPDADKCWALYPVESAPVHCTLTLGHGGPHLAWNELAGRNIQWEDR